MRICVVFLAGGLLISGNAADGDVDAPGQAGRDGGACESFGNRFCNGACKQPPGSNDTFSCSCPTDEFYFDAVEQKCLNKTSCRTTECPKGYCKEEPNKVYCSCERIPHLSSDCKVVDENYRLDCDNEGGEIVIPTAPKEGPRCVCGDWSVSDLVKNKCVPTTCLKPTVTCKELCEKRLLGKDPRCCQGWNETDCTREPKSGTYCSPGRLMTAGGECEDACSAKAAELVCPHGCQSTRRRTTAYQCQCPQGWEVAEDGISCKDVYKERPCYDFEKKACRSDQYCEVRDKKINCRCRSHEHLLDGVCTGKCGANNCHENFSHCTIYDGKQQCMCPWQQIDIDDQCTLESYYYTVSFKPNISLGREDCDYYGPRIREAMKTTLGSRVDMVEILNCKNKIEARLILKEPLPKQLRKKLQMCEYQEGSYCMLYPSLPIEKGSATGIEEENLCESVLKEQEAAYNGTNKCVKDGYSFWFKCAPGYKEVKQETRGRLRRSICERTDDPPVRPESRDDPASKGTTAEPEKSAGSSPYKPHLLHLLLYGGVVTLLEILH